MISASILARGAAVAAASIALAGVAQASSKKPAASASIVDVAIAVNSEGPFAGLFDTLVAAVLAADPVVLHRLTTKGQSTVFAPTDDAFAALGLTPENIGPALPQEVLTEILLYHVGPGRRDSTDVLAGEQIRTLQGGFFAQAGGVLTHAAGNMINIIVTDVPAENGFIHVIDGVLMPLAN
jgi:uncharacterized surface protein with fasciclin (FAS1) repeats